MFEVDRLLRLGDHLVAARGGLLGLEVGEFLGGLAGVLDYLVGGSLRFLDFLRGLLLSLGQLGYGVLGVLQAHGEPGVALVNGRQDGLDGKLVKEPGENGEADKLPHHVFPLDAELQEQVDGTAGRRGGVGLGSGGKDEGEHGGLKG